MFLVGVDEAGRGPLAGPVAVGVAVVPHDFDWALIPGVADSKKIVPKKREAIFSRTEALKKEGVLDYAVVLISVKVIDTKGITYAVKSGIERAFKKLALDPEKVCVKLDGLLKAPRSFTDQETIIEGDAKEKVIGLASIMAKVTRDRCMLRLAKRYEAYGFEVHKGYATEMHRESIRKFGPCVEHRRIYIRNIVG